jgi:hypothetical protein
MIKAKNKEINDLQLRIHQLKNQLQAGSSGQGCDPVETLKSMTMAVIDPESVGGFRYPDTFSEGTSVYKAKGTFFLPVLPSTAGNVLRYPAGSFYCECRPELDDTILYLDEIDATNEAFHVNMSWSSTQDSHYYGMYDGRTRVRDSGTTTSAGQTFGLVLNALGPAGELQDPIYLDSTEASAAGYYYNPCISARNATDGISSAKCSIRLSDNGGTIDVDMTLRQVDQDGTVLASNTVNAIAAGTYTPTISALASSSSARGSWRLEIEIVSSSGNSVFWNVSWARADYWADILVMRRHALPKLSVIRSDFEKFRVTAQSLLVTYEGSTLTNAGFISSILYRGGHPASLAGVYDYSSIAEHPISYDGALRDGTYGYWEPMDWTDMAFRCPMVPDMDKEYPYLVTSGLYNGDASSGTIDQTNILRCKVILQIEFTSSAQTYDIKPSPVCPEILADVALITSGVPNVMENGKHLQKLKAIASKAGKVARALGSFAWQHRAEIVRLAEAAAPIIATF